MAKHGVGVGLNLPYALVVPWLLFLPSAHASDVLEMLPVVSVCSALWDLFVSWWKALLRFRRFNYHSPILLSYLPLGCPCSGTLPRQNGLLKPHQGQGQNCCSSVLPGTPALSSLTSHTSEFYIPLSTYHGSLALEIPFYLCFSIPGRASRINMVWCRAKALLGSTEMPRVSNMPSSGTN